MDSRGRIRLSTMEIVLICTLLGSLALTLLQAWQQDHQHQTRTLDAEH